MSFTTEEIIGCTNKGAKGANKVPRNPLSCFFISCFTVLVTLSINALKTSNDFMILVIYISSLKISKVNLIPALTAHFRLIFLSNLFIAFKVKFFTNPDKLPRAIGIATFLVLSFLNYLNKNQKIHLIELF